MKDDQDVLNYETWNGLQLKLVTSKMSPIVGNDEGMYGNDEGKPVCIVIMVISLCSYVGRILWLSHS